MAYGPSQSDLYERAADYIDLIIEGASLPRGGKPTDLVVEQPIKIEPVINLKTVRALGLSVSPTPRFQATEVLR
jgi:hypothetical protein